MTVVTLMDQLWNSVVIERCCVEDVVVTKVEKVVLMCFGHVDD